VKYSPALYPQLNQTQSSSSVGYITRAQVETFYEGNNLSNVAVERVALLVCIQEVRTSDTVYADHASDT
jgi:hypothetical protein